MLCGSTLKVGRELGNKKEGKIVGKILVIFKDGTTQEVEGDFWRLDLDRTFVEIFTKGCGKGDCQNERVASFNIGEVKTIRKGE